MTLNPFFNTYQRTSEQNLLEDLIIESIKMYGQELLYLPRRRGNFDQIDYDDDQSYFDTAYPIEMYIKSIDGFGGDRAFMSKFDIEIRDQIVFSVSRRRWTIEIGNKEEMIAPKEGDLIYFPLRGAMFQVMMSDNKPFFYQLGNLQLFDLTCEQYEYDSSRFTTGIAVIDSFQEKYSQNLLDYGIIDHSGNYIVDHDGNFLASEGLQEAIDLIGIDDTQAIQTEQEDDDIVLFTERNPYAEKNY